MERCVRVNLTGITWDHPRGFAPLVATAETYCRQSGICVDWAKRTLRGFGDESVAALARAYDLLIIDHPWVGFVASTGCLAALDSLVPGEVLKRIASGALGKTFGSYGYGGHQWALPVDAAAQVSAHRPDLLRKAGGDVPRTWAEVIGLARRLRASDLAIAVPLNSTDAFPALLTACANRERDPFLRGGYVFDRDAVITGLASLRELADASDPRSLRLNPAQLLDEMATSDHIAYSPILFGYSNYSRSGFRDHLISFSNIPSAGRGPIGSTLGGAGIAISAVAADPAGAASYATWAAGAEVQVSTYFDAGGQPSQRSAWTDDRLDQEANGFFTGTMATLENAYVRPRFPGFVPFQIEAGAAIHEWLAYQPCPVDEFADRLVTMSLGSGGNMQ